MENQKLIKTLAVLVVLFFASCGGSSEQSEDEDASPPQSMVEEEEEASDDPMKNKGIGPVEEVTLSEEIDQEMAAEGKEIYDQMCTACHKATEKFIGPAPKGILDRRSPEWVMNMILNPEEMVKKDPIAKRLLVEYNMAPMANQGLTREQARKILEYFRTIE